MSLLFDYLIVHGDARVRANPVPCEYCTFFVTTLGFRPTPQRQRENAAAKGQMGRQKIFDGPVN